MSIRFARCLAACGLVLALGAGAMADPPKAGAPKPSGSSGSGGDNTAGGPGDKKVMAARQLPAPAKAAPDTAFGKRSEVKDSNDKYANIEVEVQAAPAAKGTKPMSDICFACQQDRTKTSTKKHKEVLDFVKQ